MGAFAGGSAAELPSLEEELAQVLIIQYFGRGARNSIFWNECYDIMYSIFWGQVSEWSLLAKVRWNSNLYVILHIYQEPLLQLLPRPRPASTISLQSGEVGVHQMLS